MKRIYPYGLLLWFVVPSVRSLAQCTCSDGSSPDSVVYSQHYDSIISTNTAMVFPQFNDTVGLLSCLRLSDTVTTVVNYNLENNLDTTEDYNFETYRRSQFSGPGGFFSSVVSPPKDYGPYTLGPYDPVGHTDEIDVGPDTVFNKNAHTQYFSGNSSYYGQGNVTLNYLTTSTFTILTGSDNAIIKLKAYTRLDAQLVYYWCPFSVLETNLLAFDVSSKNNQLVVAWKISKPHTADQYVIEVSTDGRNFTELGSGTAQGSGPVISSELSYVPPPGYNGNVYFRIRQTSVGGKVFYSEVRSINVHGPQEAKLTLYPNPATSGVNLQFVNNTAGAAYRVELINSYGQLLFAKVYVPAKAGVVNIQWPNKPAAGTYFLKLTDMDNHHMQVERLKIL